MLTNNRADLVLALVLVGFISIRVAIFYAGLPKPNATLLLYPGLGPAMLRRLRRESLPVSIGGVSFGLGSHIIF